MDIRPIITPIGRAAFVYVYRPDRFNDKDTFKLTLILDRKADLSEIYAIVNEAIQGKWGSNTPTNLQCNIVQDGDTATCSRKDQTLRRDRYPVFAGSIFLELKTNSRPGVVDAQGIPLPKEGEFKAGDYCRCQIVAIPWENSGNYGVSLYLNHVQKTSDGEALGGGGGGSPVGVFGKAPAPTTPAAPTAPAQQPYTPAPTALAQQPYTPAPTAPAQQPYTPGQPPAQPQENLPFPAPPF